MAKKNCIEYAGELHAIIDEVSELVKRCMERGFVPTFSVKAGVLGMVAAYHPNQTNGTGRRGRPRKNPIPKTDDGE